MNPKKRGLTKKPSDVAIQGCQAQRILLKFGGPYELQRLLRLAGTYRSVPAIYRWMYPKDKGGSGGIIPSSFLVIISDVARLAGIVLTSEDLDPRPTLRKKK